MLPAVFGMGTSEKSISVIQWAPSCIETRNKSTLNGEWLLRCGATLGDRDYLYERAFLAATFLCGLTRNTHRERLCRDWRRSHFPLQMYVVGWVGNVFAVH